MASFVRCDGGCRRESPDTDGIEIQKNWWRVQSVGPVAHKKELASLAYGRGFYGGSVILCPDCYDSHVSAFLRKKLPDDQPELPSGKRK